MCVIFGGEILAQERAVADAGRIRRIEMERRAIKKVVLIIKQLFGLDIWPLACAKNETSFCRILRLGLGWAKSNAFGVAPGENFGNSAQVLLLEIYSGQRKL
jgi:hypothetical protein